MLNIDYKILAKVLNNRIVTTVKNFVSLCQTDFITDGLIIDNVMTANLALQLAKEKSTDGYTVF